MSSSVKELNGLEPENGIILVEATDVKESNVANPNASRPCRITLINQYLVIWVQYMFVKPVSFWTNLQLKCFFFLSDC